MPLGGSLIFVGLLGVLPVAVSTVLEAAGACLLVYALATQYGGMLKRPTAPLVLGTVMLEGLFVFGGLAYLASSLTDRFGINYAYAGLMVAGFGCGGLVYSFSVKKLVTGIGELGVLLLGGTLLGVAFVFIGADAGLALVRPGGRSCWGWATTRCTARCRPGRPSSRRRRAARRSRCLRSSSSSARPPARSCLAAS